MIWPAHCTETRGWNPRHRQGSRADRTLETVDVSIPPMIGSLDCDLVGGVARAHEEAVIDVARLEAGFGEHLEPRWDFMLSSGSGAS